LYEKNTKNGYLVEVKLPEKEEGKEREDERKEQ
jgi:hypothetical protein